MNHGARSGFLFFPSNYYNGGQFGGQSADCNYKSIDFTPFNCSLFGNKEVSETHWRRETAAGETNLSADSHF